MSVAANTIKGEKFGSHVRTNALPLYPNQNSFCTQIFLGALIIQLISFSIFTLIFLCFVYHVRKFEHEAWFLHRENRWYNDWRMLGIALGVSCVGIVVRPMVQ